MNRTPFLDFMGTTGAAATGAVSAGFAVATPPLLILAWLGRQRQLRG
jgi:hypothetical protein